jgi:hypothetical protein
MKSILVFVLFATTMCWMMFSPVYKHVLIVRQAVIQQEVDYMLEVGANGTHGYISNEMVGQSRARLATYGLTPDSLRYTVESTSGASATNPRSPLPRGTGIKLSVSYPVENLFEIDRLIGVTPVSPDTRMTAMGTKMSEYTP